MSSPGAFIPVERLTDLPPEARPLDPQGIVRTMTALVRKHIYTEIPVEQLVATLDPPTLKARRGEVVAAETFTQFDRSCAYELRYRKGLAVSQSGVTGRLDERLFARDIEYQFLMELKALQEMQPNCDWRLVGAQIRQVNLASRQMVSQPTEPELRITKVATDEDYARNGALLGSASAQYAVRPDVRWMMPMVFADVAKAELVDPNQVDPEARPTSDQVYKYIQTRQLRWLTAGQRKNRDLAVELLRTWEKTQLEGAESTAPVPAVTLAFTEEQRAEIVSLRQAGVSAQRIARLLGATVEDVEAVLEVS